MPERVEFRDVVEYRRHRKPLRKLRIADEFNQLGRQHGDARRDQVKLGTGCKGSKDVKGREIKMERRVSGETIGMVNAKMFERPGDKDSAGVGKTSPHHRTRAQRWEIVLAERH